MKFLELLKEEDDDKLHKWKQLMRLHAVLEEQKADEERKYKLWKELVNMPTDMLKAFISSELGKEAGLSRQQAKEAGGIKRGRDSARAILRMRGKALAQWNDNDKDWMSRQISFISRTCGSTNPLLDEEGKPTHKLTSLWIWGHVPNKLAPTQYMNERER